MAQKVIGRTAEMKALKSYFDLPWKRLTLLGG